MKINVYEMQMVARGLLNAYPTEIGTKTEILVQKVANNGAIVPNVFLRIEATFDFEKGFESCGPGWQIDVKGVQRAFIAGESEEVALMTEVIEQPTPEQLQLLKHTLGLDWQKKPYRNYFCADPGHADLQDLDQLVTMGLMKVRRDPMDQVNESYLYHATDAGCKAVGLNGIQDITR